MMKTAIYNKPITGRDTGRGNGRGNRRDKKLSL